MTLVKREATADDNRATFFYQKPEAVVCNEFTAIVAQDEDWYIAFCLEIPEANGQGKTREGALENLAESILLALEFGREGSLRGVPSDAIREVIVIQ